MIARHLMRHRVKVARPNVSPTTDAYGNPAGALVEEPRSRPAFVQQDGKTEIRGEGDDTVVADYSVYLDAAGGDPPHEGCELRWLREGVDTRVLAVIGVREEQGPGRTHHLRVLCSEAPAPTEIEGR